MYTLRLAKEHAFDAFVARVDLERMRAFHEHEEVV